jgi:hypothetical protein
MINQHCEKETFEHKLKVIEGINDLLEIHNVPDLAISAILKDIGIINDPDALPICDKMVENIKDSRKIPEQGTVVPVPPELKTVVPLPASPPPNFYAGPSAWAEFERDYSN